MSELIEAAETISIDGIEIDFIRIEFEASQRRKQLLEIYLARQRKTRFWISGRTSKQETVCVSTLTFEWCNIDSGRRSESTVDLLAEIVGIDREEAARRVCRFSKMQPGCRL
jgi:hypothetical protein